MSFQTLFVVLNCTAAALVTGLMVFMLIRFGPSLNLLQRMGCGFMGGSSFLIIPPILDVSNHGTPFDLWPSFFFRLGVLLYLSGAMWRLWGHEWRNAEQRRMAEAHFAAKGMDADQAARERRGKK